MNTMRRLITLVERYQTLVEAAHPYGKTFWFNPLTKAVIDCGDHGDRVAQDPGAFGIDQHAIWQMLEQGEASDDEADAGESEYLREPVDGLWGEPSGWGVNDAWEQLAMNQGWVRVGLGGRSYATYVSSSDARSVWACVAYLVTNDLMTDKLEIEISRQQNSRFLYLGPETIDRFVRGGGRNAEGFLARLDTA